MKWYFVSLIFVLTISAAKAQTSLNPQMGYTYKVETGVAGKQVYISGQRPFDASGQLVGAGDLSAQTQQVFQNLTAALERVGMTMRNVTQVTYLLKGKPGQVDAFASQQASGVGSGFFNQTTPGMQEIKSIAKIARDDVLVEVEVVAVKQ